MTADQWYNLVRLALILGFSLAVLYGLYRVMTSDDRKPDRKE